MSGPTEQSREQLKQANEELTRSNEKLRVMNNELLRKNERIEKDLERLRQERDRLKERLDAAQRTGKRQAGPFSKGEPRPNPKRPGRKKGAQYGRKAHRPIPEKVDEEVEVQGPEKSLCCGAAIDNLRVEDQYQTEIVRKTHVTCFHVHVGNCHQCGKRVQGRHERQTSEAAGAAASQVGAEALALAAVINKQLGIPLGKTTTVLKQAFGLSLTPGGLSQALGRMASRCEPTYEDLKGQVHSSASVTMDESGWRVGGQRGWWLWTAVTEDTTVYGIFPGRGYEQAIQLLAADFNGFLIHDGWIVYRQYVHAHHQSCNGHIIIRCKELTEGATRHNAVFPGQVKAVLQKGLDLRNRHAAGELSEHGLASLTGKLEIELERLIDRDFRNDDNRKLAKHVGHELPYLFTYLKCPGLEATNWRAEQAIRPAVVARKVWGGNRTRTGAHAQEILSSVLGDIEMQNASTIMCQHNKYI